MADAVNKTPAVHTKKRAPAKAENNCERFNKAFPEGTTVYPACDNIFTVFNR